MSAAPDQQPPVKGPGGGTPPRQDEIDLWMLVHEHGVRPRDGGRIMGMHHKRLWYLCEKWSRQGKYDYGVTCDLGWSVERNRRTAREVTINQLTPELAGMHNVTFHPPPPPPPFSGASMAVRAAMHGKPENPELRKVAEKARKTVRRRAVADARRIIGADLLPTSSRHPMAIATAMLMHGQVFIDQSRRPAVTPHATVRADGGVVWHVDRATGLPPGAIRRTNADMLRIRVPWEV